jgi:HEAT repeat protein
MGFRPRYFRFPGTLVSGIKVGFRRLCVAAVLLLAGVLRAGEADVFVERLGDEKLHDDAEDALVRMGAAAVPALLQDLEHGEDALLRIGAPAVGPLVEALPAADDDERYAIITTLGRFGPVARDAVPALRRELAGPWGAVAAEQLTKIVPDAVWGVSTMVAYLEREGSDQDIYAALARLGPLAKPAVPILRKHGRGAAHWSVDALRALWWIEHDAGKLLPDLRKALATEDVDDAATVLGIMGEAARPAVPDLLRVVVSPPEDVNRVFLRKDAFDALVEIGLRPEDANAIRPWLKADDEQLQANGAALLGSIRPFPEKWVATLSGLLEDESANVRYAVTYALGQVGHAEAVPALVRACADDDPDVSCIAARALGQYPDDPATVPALCRMIREKEGWHRWHAAWVLGEIGATSAAEALEAELDDPDDGLRRGAAEALGKLKAHSAVGALKKLLDDPKAAIPAAIALHRITGEVELAPFRHVLASDEVRPALWKLEEMGAAGRPLLPLVRKLRSHRNPEIAAGAVYVAYTLGDDARDAVRRLVHLAAIQYDVFDARMPILFLGDMGPAAAAAKPFLTRCLRTASSVNDYRVVRDTLDRIDSR